MVDYDKLLQVPRGTKARLETIKLNLLVNTLVYATDTKELGIKLSDGNIEYFKNATDINTIVASKYNVINFFEGMGDFNIDTDCNEETIYINVGSSVGTFPPDYYHGGFLIQTRDTGDESPFQTLFSPVEGKIYIREVLGYDEADNQLWSEWKDHFGDRIDTLETSKQDKLTAGTNITINPITNVISASGGGGGDGIDLNTFGYMDYAADIFYRARQQSLFSNAWEHSLIVDPLEISVNSLSESQIGRGRAQYPNGAFEGVIIPQGVTSIGNYAFKNWQTNNQQLVIPNSVTTIGSNAFYNWTSNNQPLVIPNSVTDIGNFAFNYWETNNQLLIIPNSVTIIGNGAFSNWQANNQPLTIPNGVMSIGGNAFYNWTSNNRPLTIPNSVTSIGAYAFRGWDANNQPLTIPNSVTSIGGQAFSYWSANNQPLTIPNSVTSIENGAFSNWASAKEFIMESETPPTITSTSFINTNNAPFYVPDASVTAYKTATNWVDLADRIFSINDKTGVIGDIESALDAILGV